MLSLSAETRVGDIDLDVALEVPRGECLALTGPSGAGKTSVLRIAAGLLQPRSGRVTSGEEVWLDTEARVDRPPDARRVGYVFQDHALFGHMTACENVAYPMHGPDRRERALALLDRFGLAARADARPRTLSGGERQRVALARALAREPELLLLDEPLASLDPRTRASASRELSHVLRETGVPALLVTHDFTEAATLADRVAVLDGGHIVQAGPAADLSARPASAFVADLTGAVVLTGHARRDAGGTVVALGGGGEITSTDDAQGPVAATIHPWEIVLEPEGTEPTGSARNHVIAQVVTVTSVGSRVRVGLSAGQPLAAEVTPAAVDELRLAPGTRVVASWKAAATRLVPR